MASETRPPFERRMVEAAKLAANLGLALRDLRNDFPHMIAEDLLDFAAAVVNNAFEAPPQVREIRVGLGWVCETPEAPLMQKPETVQ